MNTLLVDLSSFKAESYFLTKHYFIGIITVTLLYREVMGSLSMVDYPWMIRKGSNCESASDSYPPVSPIRSEWSSDHLQILLFKRKFKNIFLKNAHEDRARAAL